MVFESVTRKYKDVRARLCVDTSLAKDLGNASISQTSSTVMLTHSAAQIAHQERRRPDQEENRSRDQDQDQDQDQALSKSRSHRGEEWTPWSSEDEDAHHYELNHNDPRCFRPTRRHSEGETLLQLRREPPAASPPAYYDPGTVSLSLPSYHVSQHILGCASDMPHRGKPPPPPRNPKRLAMSKTQEVDDLTSVMHHDTLDNSRSTKPHGSVRKNARNIMRLRPHALRPQRSSSLAPAPITSSALASHPAAMNDTGGFPMPPVSPKVSPRLGHTYNLKSNVQDQHKKNVRRPPKGTQHWFDAYISSDDQDEGDADTGEPEPQELPAEGRTRPAHIYPERASSLAVVIPARAMASMPDDSAIPCNNPPHTPARSESWNSIQSSRSRGRGRTLENLEVGGRLAATTPAQESVLSLSTFSSDNSSDESDDYDVPGLPGIGNSIRDSILDDRNFEVASAASIRLQRLSPSGSLNAGQGLQSQPQQSMNDLQSAQSFTPTPLTQTRFASPAHNLFIGHENVDATPRRLNGSGSAKYSANSTSHHGFNATHIVAVTDEEMMVLEMMRKKRAEMIQESFAECYAMALRSEQQRLATRAESAPQAAVKVLQKKRGEKHRREPLLHDQERECDEATSLEAKGSTFDMHGQLDVTREAQVDAGFQIEPFLGGQPSSYATPVNPKSSENFLLPATVYTPESALPKRPTSLESQSDVEARMEVQRRVEQFIASQGAVPPLDSIKTMRRPSNQALSPTHTVEEAMPPIPPVRESPPGSPGADAHGLQHKVSVIHRNHAGMQRTSPGSAFPSHSSPGQESGSARHDYPAFGAHHSTLHSAHPAERPRTASAPFNRRVTPHRSLPRLNTSEAFNTQRSSTLVDVLNSWHDLGGTSFLKSPETSGQSVQT